MGLNAINAQNVQQGFEGTLSSPWVGNGEVVGSQGDNLDPHNGGGMYKLRLTDDIYVSLSLSPVTKYIGLWINFGIFQENSLIIDLMDNSGNVIQNIATHPASSSGYWYYKQFQLGAGYAGNYRISFSRDWTNFAVAGYAIYLDDIVITTTTQAIDEISECDFKMYPNPMQNKFNLIFRSAIDNLNIEIIDIAGKIVYSEKESISLAFNETKEIDVSSLNSGIYFCKISNGKKSFVKKIVIE